LFIPDPDPDLLPIPDPGVKKALETGSRIRIRNTAENILILAVLQNDVEEISAAVGALQVCAGGHRLPHRSALAAQARCLLAMAASGPK
jgi:hypothetical protein